MSEDKQPISVLFDRVMVQISQTDGERRSRAGILIPATAQISRRLTWAEAVAVGPHVRTVKVGDTVLFNPEDRFEVEVHGEEYVILRERDIHAIASPAQRQRHGALPLSAPGAGTAPASAAPEGVPLTFDEALARRSTSPSSGGLVPAIVQDATDGTVLTMAYMDAEALRRTLETGRSWFYSRSRQEYWQKGETSGDRQYVREVRMDCDGDALVVLVDQHGRGACHTGERTCFYRTIGTGPGVPAP